MDGTTITELVKVSPTILWFLFAVIVLWLFYQPLRNELLPKLSSLKALGVELSLVKNSIDAAVELAQKSPQWKVEISPDEKQRALTRAKQHLDLFRGAQIL